MPGTQQLAALQLQKHHMCAAAPALEWCFNCACVQSNTLLQAQQPDTFRMAWVIYFFEMQHSKILTIALFETRYQYPSEQNLTLQSYNRS